VFWLQHFFNFQLFNVFFISGQPNVEQRIERQSGGVYVQRQRLGKNFMQMENFDVPTPLFPQVAGAW